MALKKLDLGEVGNKRLEEISEQSFQLDTFDNVEVVDIRSPEKISEAFKAWKKDSYHQSAVKDYNPKAELAICHLFYFKPKESTLIGVQGDAGAAGIQLFPFCKVLKVGSKLAELGIYENQIYNLNKQLFIGFHQPYDWAQGVPKSGHVENSYILEIDRPMHHLVVNYKEKKLEDMFFRYISYADIQAEFNGVI